MRSTTAARQYYVLPPFIKAAQALVVTKYMIDFYHETYVEALLGLRRGVGSKREEGAGRGPE